MKLAPIAALMLLTAAGSPAIAAAQRLDDVRAGMLIRVETADKPPVTLTGRLISIDSAGIRVAYGRDSITYAIERRDVARVEYSVEKRTRPGGARRGAGRGFLIGLGLAVAATTTAYIIESNGSVESDGAITAVFGIFSIPLPILGGVIGGVVGGKERDVWLPAALPAP